MLTSEKTPRTIREIHQPEPVLLSQFSARRREASRPVAEREPSFAERFDDDTLFYDVFWDDDARTIRMIGPPLLNLATELAASRFSAPPMASPLNARYTELEFACRYLAVPPPGTERIALDSPLGHHEFKVGKSHTDDFADRRVIITLSKNNRLSWIQDWMRYHRDNHGSDAVLLYDNASTDYTTEALLSAMSDVEGFKTVVVVKWPFKYGPQGRADGSHWESFFSHRGMLENARHRYLARARSVVQCDIDELIVCRGSIHEKVEASLFGALFFYGTWVIDGEQVAQLKPGQPIRHRDLDIRLPAIPQRRALLLTLDANRCRTKYAVVPRRCPSSSQWDSHNINRWLAGHLRDLSLTYRHFRSISTSWKYERKASETEVNLGIVDGELRTALDRVRWDS